MRTKRIEKIRKLWRDWGHMNVSPASWMSDDELEAVAKRIPKRFTAKRFVTDSILEKT